MWLDILCNFAELLLTVFLENLVDALLQVRDVVFIHNNLRLAERVTDISYTEATVDWEEWESESDSDEQ